MLSSQHFDALDVFFLTGFRRRSPILRNAWMLLPLCSLRRVLVRHLLPTLKLLKASIHGLVSMRVTQFVYGWEQMSCWSIHVKRPLLCFRRI
ncbi:hypothetical protein LINGRAHAP2_LOCUS6179 [Linum grandiflorum]